MARANKFRRRRSLNLGQQVMAMKWMYPQFSEQWHRNRVSWTGTIQPTALSSQYTVRITYQLDQHPVVDIVSPKLRPREDDESISHTYPGDRPCLYHPRLREWHSGLPIAETIIPWLSLWLYFYEVWHATGEWLGKGEHPKAKGGKKVSS